MRFKAYDNTHMEGHISIENDPFTEYGPGGGVTQITSITGDLGIQIAEDGRVWICIDGISFLRFTPTNKYHKGDE